MIKVTLKPEKGIQIDETKKYLFDPSVVQPYVDASAENATKAEEQANRAEQTFANVSAFVDTSKSEITGIIEQGKTEIATAIDDGRMEISDSILEATEEVKKAGSEAAQEAVQGAADEATRIATEQVNTYVVEVVSPQIQEFVNNAEADASNAAESAGLAAEEASKSSVFASDSQHYAEDARIWAEGEQNEVQELGGALSSMGAADLAYAIANAPEDTPIDASGLFAMNVVKGEKGDKGDKGDDGKDGGGLEIGDVAFAVMGIDETKNLRRYLNGQVISQTQFVSFSNWVKERAKLYPNTVATEENWQAEVTNSKLGQCGKFVIDDTLGTIRLPKVVNINGLQDLALMGSVKAESLPNITGTIINMYGGGGLTSNGAFSTLVNENFGRGSSSGGSRGGNTSIDASLSSSAYQDNAPVQQEAIQYPYFIQVATGVEESVDVTREIELNNPFSLLDYKWSEYELNNASWLLSNGAFHSGTVYKAVYELLLKIKNGTETKEGVSVKLSTEAYTDTDFVINTADTTFRLPIKVKLASGNAVVGNGMTLGLTNGTDNGGLITPNVEGARALAAVNAYGVDVSSSAKTVDDIVNGNVGVTTDPTKSGIETSSSGLKLYFYVGETIQDANVVVASNVLNQLAGSSKLFDGQWVQKKLSLNNATAVGSYTHDLSEYLPNDGNAYEVNVYVAMASENTTVYGVGTIASPCDNTDNCFFGLIKTTSNARFATGNFTLPVKDRVIYSQIATNKISSSGELFVTGYRRLGTNR